MTTPSKRDLTLRKNSDYNEALVFTTAGVAVDFTGWTFTMVLRKGPQTTDTSVLTVNTVASNALEGIYIPTPTNGTINIWVKASSLTGLSSNPITTSDTYQSLSYNYYYYDLKATNASTGQTIVYLYGVVSLYDGQA